MSDQITKTIGKNTLGDNNKMKVSMSTYNRSTNNLSYIWRNSQQVGTLVPFMCEVAQRGDTWDIELESKVLTHPTVGPLFGSLKLQNDLFEVPIRLYNGWLHNNKLGIGNDISVIKLPQIEYFIDNKTDCNFNETPYPQISPSCILAYLGIRGIGYVGENNEDKRFSYNATALLGYWDIFKNYYANKQEENAYYMGINKQFTDGSWTSATQQTPIKQFNPLKDQNGAYPYMTNKKRSEILLYNNFNRVLTNEEIGSIKISSADGLYKDFPLINAPFTINNETPGTLALTYIGIEDIYVSAIIDLPQVRGLNSFPLKNIDLIREEILYWNNASTFYLNQRVGTLEPVTGLIQRINNTAGNKLNTSINQFGLLLKTYQSDLFNNWIKTEWVDNITSKSKVAIVNNAFSMDALNLATKIYDMLNRVATIGGSYQDWLETMYTDDYYQKTETPIYIGGASEEIVFQEVISQSATENEPLGTLAGRGKTTGAQKGGRIKVKVDEPSYIIGISSITPRIDYSQGNRFDVFLKTLDDFHKPALDQIGYEDLMLQQMSWTYSTLSNSAGKQPAWINYKTNFNKTFGNFAAGMSEDFMVLNRSYNINKYGIIEDLTTYIEPDKFNYIFADTSLDAMNYWVQIGVKAEVRRLISASNMPNL